MPLVNFSGLASGIDSEALIAAVREAEEARIAPQRETIEKLEDTNAAFEEYKSKLKALSDAAQTFRTLNGGAVRKSGTSSDESTLTVSADNEAVPTSYSATVSQVAKAGKLSFNDTNITSTTDAFASGLGAASTITVEIGLGTDKETTILNVDNTTSLDVLMTQFNNDSTKGLASIVNVGTATSPVYKIIFSANETGTQKGTVAVTVGAAITALPRFAATTSDAAANAQFTVSGISGTITRPTNQISDLFPGITMNFNKASATPVTVSVATDFSATTEVVQTFVDAYNEVVEFLNDNNLVTRDNEDDTTVIFGPLSLSSTDENALRQVRSAFAGVLAPDGTEVKVLADLGITTNRDGTLDFSLTGKNGLPGFTEALAKEPGSVYDVLANVGESLGALANSGGIIDNFTQFNGLLDKIRDGNNNLIKNIKERLARADAALDRKVETLRATFANLERRTSELQSQQSQLSAILSGGGR